MLSLKKDRTVTAKVLVMVWPAMLSCVIFLLLLGGCSFIANQSPPTPEIPQTQDNPPPAAEPVLVYTEPLGEEELETQWGIRLLQARVSAQGGMIDLRFVVTEPEKAKALEERLSKMAIVDEASGKAGWTVHSSKVGSLRDVNLGQAGRVNYILFGNPSGSIRPGSVVIVLARDTALGRLIAQ